MPDRNLDLYHFVFLSRPHTRLSVQQPLYLLRYLLQRSDALWESLRSRQPTPITLASEARLVQRVTTTTSTSLA